MKQEERRENKKIKNSDQILHGRLIPTGSRNLFTATKKRKSISQSITPWLDLFMWCLSSKTITHNAVCLQFVWPPQWASYLCRAEGSEDAWKTQTITYRPRFSRRHNTSFLPTGLRVNRRPLFRYLAISQGQRMWLGMWKQDRGFLQTCFTSVNPFCFSGFFFWCREVGV